MGGEAEREFGKVSINKRNFMEDNKNCISIIERQYSCCLYQPCKRITHSPSRNVFRQLSITLLLPYLPYEYYVRIPLVSATASLPREDTSESLRVPGSKTYRSCLRESLNCLAKRALANNSPAWMNFNNLRNLIKIKIIIFSVTYFSLQYIACFHN